LKLKLSQAFSRPSAPIATLVFVLASTFSAGLSLTVRQILNPLRNIKLVLLALVANFILVPALALILLYVFSLPQPMAIGLFILVLLQGLLSS
jgi:BASS family bile acid:Na+ symporter